MTTTKRVGLGKGLGALLSDSNTVNNPTISNISALTAATPFIKVANIEPNPFQPRKEFEKEALEELAASIKVHGLISPITVRKLNDTHFQLISGERRLRACKSLNIEEIPAYIRTTNDQGMIEMGLIENIQRENLNAMEVANSLQQMIEECSLKQEELGERVGKNRSTITNYLRLLKLPPSIQAAVSKDIISMGHAKALLSAEDVEVQLFFYNEVVKNQLSVRLTEEMVKNYTEKEDKKQQKPTQKAQNPYHKMQDELSSHFGTKITIKADEKGKGSIQIPFLSTDDFNRILELLEKK